MKYAKVTIQSFIDYEKVVEGWSEKEKLKLIEGDPDAKKMFDNAAIFLAYTQNEIYSEVDVD